MTFYQYMQMNHCVDDTPAGDLAEDMLRTVTEFPTEIRWKTPDGKERILAFLRGKHACEEAVETFLECWNEYVGWEQDWADNLKAQMWIEENDGSRMVITADDCTEERHWWLDPCEDNGTFFGVDIHDGTLEEVAKRIGDGVKDGTIPGPEALIEVYKRNGTCDNPAWDRMQTLEFAEQFEVNEMNIEEPDYRYVEIQA